MGLLHPFPASVRGPQRLSVFFFLLRNEVDEMADEPVCSVRVATTHGRHVTSAALANDASTRDYNANLAPPRGHARPRCPLRSSGETMQSIPWSRFTAESVPDCDPGLGCWPIMAGTPCRGLNEVSDQESCSGQFLYLLPLPISGIVRVQKVADGAGLGEIGSDRRMLPRDRLD